MATIIQHGTAPFWGVKASITGVYLESLEFSNSAQSAQLKDQNGKVVGVTVYDQECTFNASGTVLMGSGGSQGARELPSALASKLGEAVTLLAAPDGLLTCGLGGFTSTTAIVTGMSWTEGNEAAVSANVSGNVYAW